MEGGYEAARHLRRYECEGHSGMLSTEIHEKRPNMGRVISSGYQAWEQTSVPEEPVRAGNLQEEV